MAAGSPTRLQTDEIVAVAAEALAQDGAAGLSMRRVADRLGVTAGALYNHVPDKRTLEDLLIADGLRDQGARLSRAIDGADDRVTALAVAARAFALDHPHLYRLMTSRDMDRDGPIGPAEQVASEPVREALGGPPPARIAFWAFAHGMISLELNDRFPPGADVDEAWRVGLAGLRTQLDK
jgi:AcrR family transcriptional regulator